METKRKVSESLLKKLRYGDSGARQQALFEMRLFCKWDMDNRIALAEAGAIPVLVKLLPVRDLKLQENAITALLNLSIYAGNKEAIMKCPGAVQKIVKVIKKGISSEARATGAAVVFSLLVEESFREELGSSPSLVEALLGLLQEGSSKCKGDALKALFHLALCDQNKATLVNAGVIPLLLGLLLVQREDGKLAEHTLALLAQVAGCSSGSAALLTSGALPFLVNLVEKGSPRLQEHATSTLVGVCRCGGHAAAREVRHWRGYMPALDALRQSGSPRGQAKAESLLEILDKGASSLDG